MFVDNFQLKTCITWSCINIYFLGVKDYPHKDERKNLLKFSLGTSQGQTKKKVKEKSRSLPNPVQRTVAEIEDRDSL